MTHSERCARAFMAHYRSERDRAHRCLDQIFDLIMDDPTELTARDVHIVEAIIGLYRRDDQRPTSTPQAPYDAGPSDPQVVDPS